MKQPVKRKPTARKTTAAVGSGLIKKRKSPERDLQEVCVKFLDLQYGERLFYFHTPNGGRRHKEEGAVFKRIGVKAGIPDLLFLTPVRTLTRRYTGVAIELKAKGNKDDTSPNQRKKLRQLMLLGYFVAVVDSFDEFKKIIDGFYHEYKANVKKI